MRAFLLFLAIAVPAVLINPTFWSLWRMETSAEPVGYEHADGTTQWALIGPKSPWPGWAPRPLGTALTVKSSFAQAPRHRASGMADVSTQASAAAGQRAYSEELRRSGWSAHLSRSDVSLSGPPPRPVHICHVDGFKDGRSLRLSLFDDSAPAKGTLFWTTGRSAPVLKSVALAC